MKEVDILERVGRKQIKAEDVARKALEQPNLLNAILRGVSSTNAQTRYSCAKILRIISEENPKELYPRMNFFTELLDSDKRILQ